MYAFGLLLQVQVELENQRRLRALHQALADDARIRDLQRGMRPQRSIIEGEFTVVENPALPDSTMALVHEGRVIASAKVGP
ncbi:MAG: hypothetical protein RLZZ524_1450 [Pseudomonadota bacterium]|jgi:hypothetical protein